jgi:DNA-binding MarR family transcriptional regulator
MMRGYMGEPIPFSNPATGDAAEPFIAASRALVGIALRSINAAPVEITLPQHRAMVLLAADGDQSIGRLAEQLSVDQSNASRLCDRLERLGLIARRRSRTDGRSVDVHLTSSGTKVLTVVNDLRRREVQRVLTTMSAAQVDAAVQGLSAFSRAAREVEEQDWSAHAL